jgi:hypothetical protein
VSKKQKLVKRRRGRPRSAIGVSDGTEVIFVPVPESSSEFAIRKAEVQRMIAKIILLGACESSD